MRRAIIAAAMLALFAGPALAQQQHTEDDEPLVQLEKARKRDIEANDRQYKSTLEKTKSGETAVRVDPWANMRAPANGDKKR